MKHVVLIASAAMTAACASASNADPAPAIAVAEAKETITFALNTWGKPLAYWQVHEDGAGELWRMTDEGDFRTYRIEKFRFALPEEAGVPFIAATEVAREAAVNGLDCKRTITDMPYGTITWTYPEAERKLAFDFGCTGEGTGKVYDALGKAYDVIEKQAKIEDKPFAVEHVGPEG